METIDLSICVGSSCHLKGSKPVIDAVNAEIAKRELKSRVNLKAAFCLGHCGQGGVCVKVGDKVISGLTPEKVPSFFETEILPLLD